MLKNDEVDYSKLEVGGLEMSYEHELKSLEYKLKRAKQIHDDALDDENEVDIELAEKYVEYIERQIGVYEKAQAFDQIAYISETSDNHLDFSDEVDSVIKKLSGGQINGILRSINNHICSVETNKRD